MGCSAGCPNKLNLECCLLSLDNTNVWLETMSDPTTIFESGYYERLEFSVVLTSFRSFYDMENEVLWKR
jgi:hypothetical protein